MDENVDNVILMLKTRNVYSNTKTRGALSSHRRQSVAVAVARLLKAHGLTPAGVRRLKSADKRCRLAKRQQMELCKLPGGHCAKHYLRMNSVDQACRAEDLMMLWMYLHGNRSCVAEFRFNMRDYTDDRELIAYLKNISDFGSLKSYIKDTFRAVNSHQKRRKVVDIMDTVHEEPHEELAAQLEDALMEAALVAQRSEQDCVLLMSGEETKETKDPIEDSDAEEVVVEEDPIEDSDMEENEYTTRHAAKTQAPPRMSGLVLVSAGEGEKHL